MRLDGFKKAAVGAMANHWTRHSGDPDQERHTYRNSSIDPARTHLNYALGVERDEYTAVVHKIDELVAAADGKPTATTNLVGSIVITQPRDWPEELSRAFFQAAYDELSAQVGEDNVVGGWVHLDETTPHMHFTFVPRTEVTVMTNDTDQPLRWTKADERRNPAHVAGEVKRDTKGTIRYQRVPRLDDAGRPVVERRVALSTMFDRARMKTLHDSVSAGMNARLRSMAEAGECPACPEVNLRLREDQLLERALSSVPHEQLGKAAMAAREKVERAAREERRRQREGYDVRWVGEDGIKRRGRVRGTDELTEQRDALARSLKDTKAQVDEAKAELSDIRAQVVAAQSQADGAEAHLGDLRAEVAAETSRLERLRRARGEAEDRVESLKSQLVEVRDRIATAWAHIHEALRALTARQLPIWAARAVTAVTAPLRMVVEPGELGALAHAAHEAQHPVPARPARQVDLPPRATEEPPRVADELASAVSVAGALGHTWGAGYQSRAR